LALYWIRKTQWKGTLPAGLPFALFEAWVRQQWSVMTLSPLILGFLGTAVTVGLGAGWTPVSFSSPGQVPLLPSGHLWECCPSTATVSWGLPHSFLSPDLISWHRLDFRISSLPKFFLSKFLPSEHRNWKCCP
jgi:hypothetical protein